MNLNRALIPAVAITALIVGCESKPTERVPTTAPTAIKSPEEILKHMQYIAVRKDFNAIPVVAPTDTEVASGAAWWFQCHAGDMGITLTDEEINQFGLQDVKAAGLLAPNVSRKALQAKLDEIQAKGLPTAKPKKGEDPIQAQLPVEMRGLNVKKLDFPTNSEGDKEKAELYASSLKPALDKHMRAIYNAGFYRLLKGVPAAMWPDVVVSQQKPNAGNAKFMDVFLAYKGNIIAQVTLAPKADTTWGLTYVQFKKFPKALEKMYKESQGK